MRGSRTRLRNLRAGVLLVPGVLALGDSAHAAWPSTTPPSPSGLIVDDTGTITVWVPGSWFDIRTADPEGSQPHISASPHLPSFDELFESGVAFNAFAPGEDQGGLVGSLGDTSDCDPDYQPVSFDNGVFEGAGQWWSECGEDANASMVVLWLDSFDGSLTAHVRSQAANDADLEDVQIVLCSIGVVSGSDAATNTTIRTDVESTSPDFEVTDVTFGPNEVRIPCD